MDLPEEARNAAAEASGTTDESANGILPMQREVQRKLGRNILVLQQLERLVKSLVAEQDIAGPIGDLHDIKARRVEAVSRKTLGQIVGDLTGTFIAPAGVKDDPEGEGIPPDLSVPWFGMSFRIEMTEADFKETAKKLADLVLLRNELVHHFLEKHDIWTESGCLAADAYLDDCFTKIDAHYAELREWAKHSHEARKHAAGLMDTPEFQDFLVHGILPGGAGVFWPSCTIVKLLRDAEQDFAKDGWAVLQHAIDHIKTHEPEHTPARYGCSSWRHVLNESRQFDVRKETQAPGMPIAIKYRSRSDGS